MVDADPESFLTVAERASASFEVDGSEFTGYVAPAASVEEAEAFVAAVRADHPDATHVVPAYRVPATPDGERGLLREYASDDGEPSGSAGKPALNVLQGREVRNAAVAVVRYYGGRDLGVGGLVRAYAKSTKLALDAAGVVERVPHERFVAVVDYDDSGTVRSILESSGAAFEADYAERVGFEVSVRVDEAPGLCDRLRSATSGRVEIS
jgi:uncharacterized YigZ family protein